MAPYYIGRPGQKYNVRICYAIITAAAKYNGVSITMGGPAITMILRCDITVIYMQYEFFLSRKGRFLRKPNLKFVRITNF